MRLNYQLALLWIYFVALSASLTDFCAANELSVGANAKAVDEYIDLPIRQPEQFNYLTRDEVYRRRSSAALSTPNLLIRDYHPLDKVFAEIVDSKPWWGMHGSFVFEEGSRSIEGESEESRFILNPYLLVSASSWTAGIWDKDRVTEEDLMKPDFPFCWKPYIARIFPKRKVLQIGYDVSAFDRSLKVNERLLKDREPNREFGLVAYNARDFGYNYIFVPIDQGKNIINHSKNTRAISIEQYIHCGNSCGCSEWCNNMSPKQEEIDHFEFKALPATVKVLLWKRKPATLQEEPDMTVLIELR